MEVGDAGSPGPRQSLDPRPSRVSYGTEIEEAIRATLDALTTKGFLSFEIEDGARGWPFFTHRWKEQEFDSPAPGGAPLREVSDHAELWLTTDGQLWSRASERTREFGWWEVPGVGWRPHAMPWGSWSLGDTSTRLDAEGLDAWWRWYSLDGRGVSQHSERSFNSTCWYFDRPAGASPTAFVVEHLRRVETAETAPAPFVAKRYPGTMAPAAPRSSETTTSKPSSDSWGCLAILLLVWLLALGGTIADPENVPGFLFWTAVVLVAWRVVRGGS